MSLVPSLLQAIVGVDGEALVMHAGDKPYVVAPSGQIELASRGLTLDAVNGIVSQLLPAAALGILEEFGAIQQELAAQAEFPGESFTVVAARGGDDVWVEIRRRKIADDDRVPDEFFAPAPAAAHLNGGRDVNEVAAVSAAGGTVPQQEPYDLQQPLAPDDSDIDDVGPLGQPTRLEEVPRRDSGEHEDISIDLDNLDIPDAAQLFAPEGPGEIEGHGSAASAARPDPPSAHATAPPPPAALRESAPWVTPVAAAPPPAPPIAQQPPAPPPIARAPSASPVTSSPVAPPPAVPSAVVPPPAVTAPVVPPAMVAAPVVPEPIAPAPVPPPPAVPAPVVPPAMAAPVVPEPTAPAPVPPPPAVTAPIAPPVMASPRVEPVPVARAPLAPPPVATVPVAPATVSHLVVPPVMPAPVAPPPVVTPPAPPVASAPVAPPPAASVPVMPPAPPVAVPREVLPPAVESIAPVPPPVAPPQPAAAMPPEPDRTPAPYAVVLPISRSPIRSDAPPPAIPAGVSGLDRLLRMAAARGASTLYLSSHARPSVRVDGEIQMLEGEPSHGPNDVESLLLTLMPDRNHEALRSGVATEWISDVDGVGRVRCLSFRDHRGPGGVFRMMPVRAVSSEQLGLSSEVQALALESGGLVLVAGSRLSGKRTMISALVDLINHTRRDHVITIESEINVVHERGTSFISQREVRGSYDDVEGVARAVLREDPDVLVVESMRTAPLINVALEAAASGQLVIGGFPAHNTTAAVDRIINLYPPENRRQVQLALAENLRGIVAQVLLRKPGGGRLAAREVLLNTPAVASIIAEGRTSQLPLAIEGGRRQGMMPLNDALVGFVQSGAVDVREAYRRAADRAGFLALLKRMGMDTTPIERMA